MQLISNTSIKKDINILGVDLSYALLDIEFDDDIYTFDALACPNFTCPEPEAIDCSCDYTDINECPKITGRHSSCKPCSLDFALELPPFTFGGVYCNNTSVIKGTKYTPVTDGWTIIEVGKEYTFSTDKIMQFRFKADSKSCMGMFLKVSPIQGYPITSFGAVPSMEVARFISGSKLGSNAVFNICPSDNWNETEHYTYTKSWTRDTYMILVDPQSSSLVSFSIIVQTKKVPEIPKILPPKCTLPSNVPSTVKCINLGENTFGEVHMNTDHYVLSVKHKSYYFFQFPSLYLTTSIYISNTKDNFYPTESTSQWVRQDSYENYFTLYLYPENNETELLIYISVLSYLPTNYSFVVTRIGEVYKNQLSSMSLQQGAFSLSSSSIFLPKFNKDTLFKSKFYTCNSQSECSPFSILFPTVDLNPLWPVPSILYGVEDFDYKTIIYNDFGSGESNIINTNFKKKSYQIAILLSYNNGRGDLKEYIKYEEVLQSTVQFLSTLSDSNGNLIDIEVTGFDDVTRLKCDYKEFKRVSNLINRQSELLNSNNNSPTLSELNNWRYQLGMVSLNDAWIGCSFQANQMLDIEVVKKNISSYYCPWKEGDIEFSTDPCCNSTYQFYQCCNPRYIETQTYQYLGISEQLFRNQCRSSSFDCTASVLSEYGDYLTSNEQCGDPSLQSIQIQEAVYTTLRKCKDVLIPPLCNSDIDCYKFDKNSYCDLFSRHCSVNYTVLDKFYIDCVFHNLSSATLYSLISTTHFNELSISKKYNQHLSIDCVNPIGSSFQKRTTYKYFVDDAYIGIIPATGCLDKSCPTIYNSLFDIYYSGWEFKKEWDHLDESCSDFGICPSIAFENPLSDPESKDKCNNQGSNEFCGFCGSSSSNSSCYNFKLYENQTLCEQADGICVLFNDSYIIGTNKESCETQAGLCTHNCGYRCGITIGDNDGKLVNANSVMGCIVIGISEANCNLTYDYSGLNYHWNSTYSTCMDLNSNKSKCESNFNTKWIDCSTRGHGECSSDKLCSLKVIDCQSREECETKGGECSDLFYFKEENIENFRFGQGKCVSKHSFLQRSNSKVISCQNGQTDTLNGCFSQNQIKSKVECLKDPNNKWWAPSENEEQCLSKENYGCKIIDNTFGNLPFNYRFNEMGEHECTACQQSTSSKWTNKFTWKKATWLKGIWVENLTWIKDRKFVENELKPTFNYQSFYLDLIDAVGKQTADLYRSQTFCKKERNQNSLNSISCSCSGGFEGGDISKCFESSTPLLGLTKQCNGENSTLSFTNGFLSLTHKSVGPGCQIITVSLVSKLIFTSTTPEPLSSNFVSYKKPDNYGVLNKNGATIGTLLTDGIMTKSEQTILRATVCFDFSKISSSEKYSEFDFATNFNSTSETSSLYPMGIHTYFLNVHDKKYICSDLESVQSETVIFLINKKSGNWIDLEKELFDPATVALLYILGALFLVVGCFGCFQIVIIIMNNRRKEKEAKNNFQITHLLTGLVTLFIMLRAIYFLMMPKGYFISNPVVDYVLVVLPTFIYFSSFIFMLVIWYIIVFLVLKNNSTAGSHIQKLYSIVAAVNLVLYIFFIVVVLVFQYTKDIPINNCGTRVVVEAKNSKPQIIVSILYAVIQSLLSFVMASSFAYLGSSLYFSLKKANFSSLKSDSQKKSIKIFFLTLVCSIGFFLHCIFILILVSSDIYSIAFSFIGLIITEILPASAILYIYIPPIYSNENHKSIKNKSIQTNNGSNNSSSNSSTGPTKNKKSNNNSNNNNSNSLSNSSISLPSITDSNSNNDNNLISCGVNQD